MVVVKIILGGWKGARPVWFVMHAPCKFLIMGSLTVLGLVSLPSDVV